MKYRKIPFEHIKEKIQDLFPSSHLEKWNLIPGDIHRLAETAGITLQWRELAWWHDFEYRRREIPDTEFIRVLFDPWPLHGSFVIVVSDPCFFDQHGFEVEFDTLPEFADTVYPEICGESFFQPCDSIFVFPERRFLAILHHEGFVMQYKEGE